MARGDGTIDSAWINDPLRHSVEASSGGRLTVLYDSAGNPNHMHVLPRFRYEDLGFATEFGSGNVSAFEVNGVVKPEIFIGAYQASDVGGLGCSLPRAVPWVNVDYDAVVAACTAKGDGWHSTTVHEWAAIALWCMANGFQPRGNTNRLRAHDAGWECGIDANQSDESLTGTGPATWRHNADHSGIADLVGNAWEWQHLLKLVDGNIVTTYDNDYAAAEADWVAQPQYFDSSLSNTPTLTMGPAGAGYKNTTLDGIAQSADYESSQLLRRLLLEPAGITPQGRMYINTEDERVPCRGGSRSTGGDAGLASVDLTNGRGGRNVSIGFRPAFVA